MGIMLGSRGAVRKHLTTFAAALAACSVILACGGGTPTDSSSPAPPPRTPTLRVVPTTACRLPGKPILPPQVNPQFFLEGFTPNGVAELHQVQPYDSQCEEIWGVGAATCQASDYVRQMTIAPSGGPPPASAVNVSLAAVTWSGFSARERK
jgi:hypothetical protein